MYNRYLRQPNNKVISMTNPKTHSNKEFSTLRSIFFPIHNHELKKLVPMALMMLFILFNYTIVRNVKDSLVVNAKGSDAEIISFLKLWGTMPAAVLFMVLYSKMASIFKRDTIFYVCVTSFIAFFGFFAFLMYPNIDYLHPNHETVFSLQQYYPNFKWFISMWGNWSYCVFYILAELWGSVVLSLLFWQFANDTTKSHEAKRHYPLFGFVGNIGLILSGLIITLLCGGKGGEEAIAEFDPSWEMNLKILMSLVFGAGLIIMGLYYWMNRAVVPTLDVGEKKTKKSKPKLSIIESFKYILSSKHLLCIAILVLSYGVTINYIDVLWKGQVKLYTNGDKNAYTDYMAYLSTMTGVMALVLMPLSSYVLRRFSWKTVACIVPGTLIVTSFIFFAAVYYGHILPGADALFGGVTAVGLAVQIGLIGGAFTKASKYSLFDSTKEMAYIPLDSELRSKGKAAVDVSGGRLGKSGGALTFFILQTLIPGATLPSLIPLVAIVAVAIFVSWFTAIGKLGTSLKELNDKHEEARVHQQKEAPLTAVEA